MGFLFNMAGWSSSVARWVHNPKVIGSNPIPARVAINRPPRGATWVMLMIEKILVAFD